MKKGFFLFIITCMLFLLSCRKNNIGLSSENYIVFGEFFGECEGATCVDIYRLEQDKLFEDLLDKYPAFDKYYSGAYKELSKAEFDKTKDLMDYFPEALLSETDTVIGMPDAGDWGGIYIEYNYGTTRRFWILDLNKANVPVTYQEFIDKVHEKCQLLED